MLHLPHSPGDDAKPAGGRIFMETMNLPIICVAAFASVFMLLAFLAAVMRVIIVVFPKRAEASDTAAIAAVASVVSTLYPGGRITKVEETK
jgi:hypothetical protein